MKIRSLLLLTASSIAFASSCACSHDRDQDFLNQINETLAKDKGIITCHDAVNALKKNNIDIFNYTPINLERELVYDFDAKQFVVMENNSIVCAPSEYKKNENTFSYFKFTSVYNGNANYSQYLLDDFPETENLMITTGIDVGNHKDIKNLTYAGSVGVERNIKIRTYCDYLTVLADSDTVSYYGVANNIFVNSVKTFDIYGQNSYVQLRDGEITFKKDSVTDFVEVPTDYTDSVTVKQEKEATISCAINVKNVEALPLEPVEVATEADLITALNKDSFIRLTSEVDLTSTITIGSARSTIIDLNGYAINTSNDLTIDGYLYLLDTEYSYNENCGIFLSKSEINVNGQLLMNGGNIFYFCDDGNAAIEVKGTFNMYGGQIIVYDNLAFASAVRLQEGSSANIYYGTIFSDSSVFESYDGNLNIKAGTFTSSSYNVCLIIGGKLDISGGTFTAKNCIYVESGNDGVDINITGGSFFNENTSVGDDTNSVIYVWCDYLNGCTINIDNAYLYSRCSYIIKADYEDGVGEAAIINCNSGTYDYYLGDGTKVAEGLEEKVMIKKGGTWTNHQYA